MSYTKRRKRRGDDTPFFVWVAKDMLLDCSEWRGLSPSAKLLYLYIKSKYNGSNNGKIKLPYSKLKGVRGVSSTGTISKAQKELIQKGWIKIEQKGGLYRYYNLYELTWEYDCLD